MKQSIIILWFVTIIFCVTGCMNTDDFPVLKGSYLGQKPPAQKPEVFAPGIISHGFHELSIAFSPAGDEFFYVMADRDYVHYALVHVSMEKGQWTRPILASFARAYTVYSVCIHPDGQMLFFTGRPAGPGRNLGAQHDIYRVLKVEDRWGNAERLEESVNTESAESSVSVSSDRTLYFERSERGRPGDLWMAKWDGDGYCEGVKLRHPINTEFNESRAFITPNGDALLFQSNREGTLGVMDIYVSYRQENGEWGEPIHLGEPVNSAASDFGPSITPDGHYLFFSSYRGLDGTQFPEKSYEALIELYHRPENGYATLYWMDVESVEALKRLIDL